MIEPYWVKLIIVGDETQVFQVSVVSVQVSAQPLA